MHRVGRVKATKAKNVGIRSEAHEARANDTTALGYRDAQGPSPRCALLLSDRQLEPCQ